MIQALKTSQIQDRVVQQFQDNVSAWAALVTACPLLGGAYLPVTFPVANADLKVTHNLNSQAIAWLVGSQGPLAKSASSVGGLGAGSIYLSPTQLASGLAANAVILRATAPMVAGLWFFIPPAA